MIFRAIKTFSLLCITLSAPSLAYPAHQILLSMSKSQDTIRLSQNSQIGSSMASEPCFPGSLEYSGYLDTSDGRHLHFRFFESRTQPESSPVVLWMNGGPGSSSAHGYMYEAGPCNIVSPNKTAYNPYSWTEVANVIFLDQPAGVGYSYADDYVDTVGTSREAAQDSYRLLLTFFDVFPKYTHLPFHIMGESYGGHYAPHLASNIHTHNEAGANNHINLQSIIFINALLDPLIQIESSIDFVCDPIRQIIDPDGPVCIQLQAMISEANEKFKACYVEPPACVEAGKFINGKWGEILSTLPHNPYDYTKTCNDSESCYEQGPWTEEYLNIPFIKARLGASLNRTFSLFNATVNNAFGESGDMATRTASLLPELIKDGVRVMVMNGDRDTLADYIGSEKMVQAIESVFQDEFNKSSKRPWFSRDGSVAGTVRSAGDPSTAGNVTFVRVYGAGHLVPFDQPVAALDLLTRWISNVPI